MIIETNVKAKPTIGSILMGNVFQFENEWYMVIAMEEFFEENAYEPATFSDKVTEHDDFTAAVSLTDGELYYFKDSWKVQEYGEAKVSITISK